MPAIRSLCRRAIAAAALLIALAADAAVANSGLTQDEIEGYLRGDGMGLARAAERAGHPGPRHVLDLAGPLGLSPEQRKETRALYEAVRQRAQELGRRYVDQREALERHLAGPPVDEARLQALLGDVARTRANLRYAHMRAHLRQRAILTHDQIESYGRLRGYDTHGEPEGRH